MKKNKGITLIALVITIIILLTLAGISISALISSNGLFFRANQAKEKTENAQNAEKQQLNDYINKINEEINQITTANDRNVLRNANNSKPEGAQIIESNENKGIVIKDSNNNEWVWIDVPKTIYTDSQYTIANNNIQVISQTDYTGIFNILNEYSKDYKRENNTDEWYAIDGDKIISASTENLTEEQKILINGCGLTYDEYNTNYKKMLTSIYTNEGFWISRYEIGDNKATINNETRTDATGIEGTTPVSQANYIPYTYITCEQSQRLSRTMSTDKNKTSSLLFGVQWSLVCKFLEENTNLIKEDINVNSSRWGNYQNNSITLQRGKYIIQPVTTNTWKKFSEDTENFIVNSKTSNNVNYSLLCTTGASEDTNKMNIYDLAGNLFEFILEKNNVTNKETNPVIAIGGYYKSNGTSNAAHISTYKNIAAYNGIGFRTTIY